MGAADARPEVLQLRHHVPVAHAPETWCIGRPDATPVGPDRCRRSVGCRPLSGSPLTVDAQAWSVTCRCRRRHWRSRRRRQRGRHSGAMTLPNTSLLWAPRAPCLNCISWRSGTRALAGQFRRIELRIAFPWRRGMRHRWRTAPRRPRGSAFAGALPLGKRRLPGEPGPDAASSSSHPSARGITK